MTSEEKVVSAVFRCLKCKNTLRMHYPIIQEQEIFIPASPCCAKCFTGMSMMTGYELIDPPKEEVDVNDNQLIPQT